MAKGKGKADRKQARVDKFCYRLMGSVTRDELQRLGKTMAQTDGWSVEVGAMLWVRAPGGIRIDREIDAVELYHATNKEFMPADYLEVWFVTHGDGQRLVLGANPQVGTGATFGLSIDPVTERIEDSCSWFHIDCPKAVAGQILSHVVLAIAMKQAEGLDKAEAA